jgi:hypothetical protein
VCRRGVGVSCLECSFVIFVLGRVGLTPLFGCSGLLLGLAVGECGWPAFGWVWPVVVGFRPVFS